MTRTKRITLFAWGVIVGTVITVIGGLTGCMWLLLVGPLLFLLVPIAKRADRARKQHTGQKTAQASVTMPIVPAPDLDEMDEEEDEQAMRADVLDALRSLGYRKAEATSALAHMGSGPEDERITRALQWLGQRG